MNTIYALFLLYSSLRLSFVIDVFDFNASLNDFTPLSPMLFTVDMMRLKKSGLLMDTICVLFCLCSLFSSSSVTVVFVFNNSHNSLTLREKTVTQITQNIHHSSKSMVVQMICFWSTSYAECFDWKEVHGNESQSWHRKKVH